MESGICNRTAELLEIISDKREEATTLLAISFLPLQIPKQEGCMKTHLPTDTYYPDRQNFFRKKTGMEPRILLADNSVDYSNRTAIDIRDAKHQNEPPVVNLVID